MTDPDPKVVPLRQPASEGAAPASPPEGGRRRGLVLLAAFLAGLLVLAGAGLLRERAARLDAEARAGALVAELERVRARVEAYRLHLGEVRERVGDLQRELEALAGLVASEPEPPAPGSAEPGSAGAPQRPAAPATEEAEAP